MAIFHLSALGGWNRCDFFTLRITVQYTLVGLAMYHFGKVTENIALHNCAMCTGLGGWSLFRLSH